MGHRSPAGSSTSRDRSDDRAPDAGPGSTAGAGDSPPTALLLQGGGARAAYQAGVLKAINEMLGRPSRNPFPILCGTSAGAINAAVLAVHADRFAEGVDHLVALWSTIRPDAVFRTDFAGVAANTARWVSTFLFDAMRTNRPTSLFDVSPQRAFLERNIDLARVAGHLQSGALRALAVTASGYTSGQSCTFFEASASTPGWRRSQRIGIPVRLTIDHLLASAAIPFAFPAVKLHREFFGDGSIRQTAPLSPALHLGARRLMVVGTARLDQTPRGRVRASTYPSLAQIAGHVMASIFFDMLAVDIERMSRINRTLALMDPAKAGPSGGAMRPIEVVVACPNVPFDSLAMRYGRRLPRATRILLRTVGAMRRGGTTAISYLLFEPGFCNALIDLGYQDTMARREAFGNFLGIPPGATTATATASTNRNPAAAQSGGALPAVAEATG